MREMSSSSVSSPINPELFLGGMGAANVEEDERVFDAFELVAFSSDGFLRAMGAM